MFAILAYTVKTACLQFETKKSKHQDSRQKNTTFGDSNYEEFLPIDNSMATENTEVEISSTEVVEIEEKIDEHLTETKSIADETPELLK